MPLLGGTYLWKGQVSRIRVSARSSVKDHACSLKGGCRIRWLQVEGERDSRSTVNCRQERRRQGRDTRISSD
jgi:hypothetical protein